MIKVRSSLWVALVISVGGASAAAVAQTYPTKPIRFIVGNAPGGGTDLMARLVGQKLNEAWGQPVIVDNRPGGTGAVGSALVAKSAPDGYSLIIVTSSSHAISPALQDDLPYDPVKDFAPISLLATGPNVLIVHPSVPANSVKELVALAKAKPGTLNYASPGAGSVGHMAAELFKTVTGTDIVHVPYKGAGAAITDLIGGQVQVMFSGPGAIMPQLTSRKLKALAVANPKRAVGLDDVPTFAEAGYPAVEAAQWYGVLTSAGTPKAIVDKLNHEIVRIMQLRDVQERFLASGYNPTSTTPQQFAQIIRDDLARWKKVAKASGVRLN